MDDFITEELIQSIKELQKLYDIAYYEIKEKVDYIIKSKITNENIIEHMYDEITNIPTDKCYELFIYFSKYVASFNMDIVKDYIDIYDEIYDPIEKDKILKKIK